MGYSPCGLKRVGYNLVTKQLNHTSNTLVCTEESGSNFFFKQEFLNDEVTTFRLSFPLTVYFMEIISYFSIYCAYPFRKVPRISFLF